ncbi:UDP-N-acetylmuramate dehydrogenase [Candidatus Aerophobetes bacterium]|uniref:UDP-N-acetylenolpyruvoylglucosamine reductase n=2 Tax=Aerophobetes bacterium TaxID=2030807 RepID=A0A523ZGD3_UNCAE|nr:MAG: UDP-N-acetylmuramate dehydrogenase [Candidatus Aerophobetes bacterium]
MQSKEKDKLRIKGRVVINQPTKELTSIKIGGLADLFVIPEDLDDLKKVLSFCRKGNLPFFIMGSGSKLLVRDKGFRGVIIKLGESFKSIVSNGNQVRVGAGVDLATLIDFAAKKSFPGLESLLGIPGTVGGAIARNVSAFGKTLSEKVLSVKVLDGNDNCLVLSKKDIDFGYRTSTFLHNKDWVIIEVRLELWPGKKEEIILRSRQARERRTLTQPLSFSTAGCIFKNPSSHPAGFLIQEAGCLGMKVGNAQVSLQHANFIINKGNATARDVISLIEKVRKKVEDKFAISLELELEVI